MKITLFYVGKKNDIDVKNIIDKYYKKINLFTRFNIVAIKPSRLNKALEKQKEEMKEILKFIKEKDIVFLFDENGKNIEKWTGDYIFEYEWQSFRTKNNKLEY